MQTPIV